MSEALRHAPPQRVLFQPEMNTRQTRQSTGHLNSPHSYSNGNYGTSGAAMTIANYEPRPAVPSSMKPVVTPANNPEHFRQLRMKYSVNRKAVRGQPIKGMMLPGTGFPGPNIYIRALHALRSGDPEEQAYALHHLVKISHERGDKYHFNQFPGLAEALIAKVIDVGSVYYDVKWEICYLEEEIARPDALNGLFGTSDLLHKIRSLETLDIKDGLLPQDVAKALGLVNEAALILRNMVMLTENAHFLSLIPSVRDMIVIALNLPHHSTVIELQHYALEIAEQLTRYWILDAQDPLYLSLLAQLETSDRGRLITALRALGRIAMDYEAANKLPGVSTKTLRSICDLLLVEDEELRIACLDFLYLYTGFVDNVEILANETNVAALVKQLVQLLQHNAIAYEERRSNNKSTRSSPPAQDAPRLSAAIIEQLITLDEPERSSQWLRTCFEEDPAGEITQIQLWTAYNGAFQTMLESHPEYKSLMPAKDFITNVSSTFAGASAQVITTNQQPKYTIRGIRPRSTPVDPISKKPYMRCCWHPPSKINGFADTKHSTPKIECGEFATGVKAMWEHILSAHLRVPRDESGKWILEQKPNVNVENGNTLAITTPPKYYCHWGGCEHFPKGTESAYEVGQHVKTHLPETGLTQSVHAKHNRTPSNSTLLSTSAQVRYENFQPQFSQPVGLGSLGMGPRYSDYNYNRHTTDNRSREPLPPPAPAPNLRYYNTVNDETTQQDAAGLPLAAILVLRNLARQLGKLNPPSSVYEIPDSPTDSKRKRDGSPEHRRSFSAKKPRLSDAAREAQRESEELAEKEAESVGWVPRVFAPVKEQLFWVAAHNLTMRNYMGKLLTAVAAGGG